MYYHPTSLQPERRELDDHPGTDTGYAGVDSNSRVEIRSRTLACENTRFNVFFDHVVDPEGHEVPNYLVVEPKQQTANLVTGVAILPVRNGEIGLIRIYRPAIRDWSWEIPHGFIEAGESGRTTAVRELAEEAGIAAGTITSLGRITPDAGILAARVQLFLATDCQICGGKTTEMGLREFRFFSEIEFEDMIRNSGIQDTFTLAAWYHYILGKDRDQGNPLKGNKTP
jgi:8-oxo-dGTP pyrophosphatase MutT (NUDIX family)